MQLSPLPPLPCEREDASSPPLATRINKGLWSNHVSPAESAWNSSWRKWTRSPFHKKNTFAGTLLIQNVTLSQDSGPWSDIRSTPKSTPEGRLTRRERVHYPISPPEAPCRSLAPLILIAPGRECLGREHSPLETV